MKRIFVKEEFCMGCELCDVYCKVQHSASKDMIKAYKVEQPVPLSRLRVEKDKPVSFSVQCRHCEDSPCVNACLSGARYIDDKTGAVLHNAEKCMGCWTCVMVCPFSAVVMVVNGSGRKVVAKCDLCQGLEEPACVANCPNQALVFKEVKL